VLRYCFDFVAVLCGVVTTGPLEVVSSSPRVDDPIQPSELSCCVLRIDVPI